MHHHRHFWPAVVAVMWALGLAVMCVGARADEPPLTPGERRILELVEIEVGAAAALRILDRYHERLAELVEAHGREVRAWAGHPEPAPQGGGWHRVTKRD